MSSPISRYFRLIGFDLPELQLEPGLASNTLQEPQLPIPTETNLSLPNDPIGALNRQVRLFDPNCEAHWENWQAIDPELIAQVLPEVLLSFIHPSWQDFVVQLTNNFFSVDLDIANVPFNRGNNLTRFSEWASREHGPRRPNLRVQANTLVRGHGEIRPIRGVGESWITRVNVDFTPNVIFELAGIVPDLEIEEFAAIDPPQMTYDWSRLPESPVTDIQGGDLAYENPRQSGGSMQTPFGSTRAAPPGNHPYWMFHFNTVRDTLVASLEEAVADGHALRALGLRGLGSLNLWAFLPTLGLTNRQDYEALGVPYNTFPRRFGDLIQLLWPLFTPEGRNLREQALLINPNSEYYAHHYMDAQGHPQVIPQDRDTPYTPHYEIRHYLDTEAQAHRIPEDRDELRRLNQQRRQQGLPPVQTGQWRPIPHGCDDLAQLNEQLANVQLPELTHYRRRRIPENPHEVIRIDRQIEALNLREHLSLTLVPRRRGSVVDWIGLDLARNSERLGATPANQLPRASFRAQMRDVLLRLPFGHIQANQETRFTIRYQLNRVRNEETGDWEPRFGIQVVFEPLDLGVTDLEFGNGSHLHADSLQARRIAVNIPDIGRLVELLRQEDLSWGERLSRLQMTIDLQGVTTEGFRLESQGFDVHLDSGEIRNIRFRANAERWRVALRGLRADTLTVAGQIRDEEFSLSLGAQHQSQDLFITQGQDNQIQARMVIRGGLENGTIQHPAIGQLNFTTIDPHPEQAPPCSGANCSRDTVIRFRADPPPEGPNEERDLSFSMSLPYVGLSTPASTRLRMDPGLSSIRNAQLRFTSQDGATFEGLLDLHADMPRGFGDGPTQLFESDTSIDSQIENLTATGQVRIHFEQNQFRIEGPSDTHPLNLSFRLVDSQFHHRPQEIPNWVRRLPASRIIHTEVGIDRADVRLENFRSAEIREVEVDGQTRRRLTQLESGPITINNIEAGGNIWINLLIWGFVRGLIPQLANQTPERAITRRRTLPELPELGPLIRHLPDPIQRELQSGNFLRIGAIRVDGEDSENWQTQIQDTILHLSELGGRGQFGFIRIPLLDLSSHNTLPHWVPPANLLLNVFLNDPQRGGSFRFVAWPPAASPQ